LKTRRFLDCFQEATVSATFNKELNSVTLKLQLSRSCLEAPMEKELVKTTPRRRFKRQQKSVVLRTYFNFTYFTYSSSIAAPLLQAIRHMVSTCVCPVSTHTFTHFCSCTLRKMTRINAAFSGIVAEILYVLHLMYKVKNYKL